MRARTTATVVLAGAVMVLTAGCNFITPQATTSIGSSEPGVSTDVGSIELRNAIVFTDDGDAASLSVTLLNTSKTDQDVTFQYDSFGTTTTTSVEVPASGRVSRGTQGGEPQILLNGIGVQPGALMKVFVQYGSQTGKNFSIPVLDGSFKQYATLLPSPTPTVHPNPRATGAPVTTAP
ncbi:MAG: hypothetical protein JWP75_1593 [Frondihabitans sp.]|nr:hypothetical protein [Frondihabitans sp.]